jgi:hypothetical protein
MGTNFDARPPLDRAITNGFRTVKYVASPVAEAVADLHLLPGQASLPKPVNDDVFNAFRGFYTYDRTPLDPQPVRVEEADHCRGRQASLHLRGRARSGAPRPDPRNARLARPAPRAGDDAVSGPLIIIGW